MSLIGTIAINMKVNAAQFAAGISGVRKSLNGLASSIPVLNLGLIGIGAAASAAFYKSVTAASRLEEQTDRVKDQFGSANQKVIEFANTIGTAFGVAKTETLQAAASFAATFEGAGYAEQAVADLSIHFVKLGTDVSRFVDLPISDALIKLKSGLAGHSLAISELGVSMHEADVSAYAWAHGIGKVNAELTSSEKIQARVGYLTQAFAKARGNLAKTGDKYAGSIEALKGRLENLFATIGQGLLYWAIPEESQIGIQALETAFLRFGAAALKSTAAGVEGMTALNHSIGPMQQSIGFLADAWQNVGIAFKASQVVIIGGLKVIGDAVYALVDTYAAFKSLITGKNFQPAAELKAAIGSLDQSLAAQIDELKKLRAEPAIHLAIDVAFEQARRDIAAARDKLAKAGQLDVSKIKPTNAPVVPKGIEHKGFAGAAVLGENEATNALLQNIFGLAGQRNGPVERIAKNTDIANVLLAKVANGVGVANAPPVVGAAPVVAPVVPNVPAIVNNNQPVVQPVPIVNQEPPNVVAQNPFAMPKQNADPAKKTADNTGKANVLLQQILIRLGGQAPAGLALDAF